MRKSKREKLLDLKKKAEPPKQMTLEDLFIRLLGPSPIDGSWGYNPTQKAFVWDPAPFKGFMGPKGSAKTSAGVGGIMLRCLTQPGTKALIARQDYNDLKQTTKLRAEEMLGRLPKGVLIDRSKEPPETWYLEAAPVYDAEGNLLSDSPSQITFMGLAAAEEMGSYEFDCAFIDEASEVSDRSVHAVNGLMRNIPTWWSKVPDYARPGYTTMLAFNPTDTFHWLYTACTGLNHEGRKIQDPWIKLFIPKPGENQRNLPFDYYQRLASSMPEDMRIRLVEGMWGATFEGAPVYREFKYDLHARFDLMKRYDPYVPLIRFWDFGYNHPYVVWCQQDHMGRLLHLKELMGSKEEIKPFVERARSTIERQFFPGHRGGFFDYGDPAARQKKDTGSTLTHLAEVGIHLRYQLLGIDEGLRAVRLWLERLVDGEPILQYDREGCSILISALRGGYHLDDTGQKPVKDGYYDHPADADRYGITNVLGTAEGMPSLEGMPKSLEYASQNDPYVDVHGSDLWWRR